MFRQPLVAASLLLSLLFSNVASQTIAPSNSSKANLVGLELAPYAKAPITISPLTEMAFDEFSSIVSSVSSLTLSRPASAA
jgi:hypothetical protein